MKSKINLRLCVAGKETLIPQFSNCLDSYLEYFKIGKLFIYMTDNLREEISAITKGKADEILTYDADDFYKEYYEKFSESVKEILDYSKDKSFKGEHSVFYLRIRLVMDYYLIKESTILSDLDIRICRNIQPILDWIDSDYILYNADLREDYYQHSPEIMNSVGADFFTPIPYFNCGWMCVPKGIRIDINEVFEILKMDKDCCPAEMEAMAISLIKNNIKTKLLPKELMVCKNDNENKALAHLGPYGLNENLISKS